MHTSHSVPILKFSTHSAKNYDFSFFIAFFSQSEILISPIQVSPEPGMFWGKSAISLRIGSQPERVKTS